MDLQLHIIVLHQWTLCQVMAEVFPLPFLMNKPYLLAKEVKINLKKITRKNKAGRK